MVVTPSGTLIADVAEKGKKRVVFIASADHAHAHRKSGPYGFSRAAARYDALMVQTVQGNNLRSVLRIDPKLVRDAKPDSLWQMAMLAGVAARLRMRPELYSYAVPTYYGMICAAFRR